MGPAEVKETHEAMGSWTGSAEVKKTWEMKEEFLVRALGSKTYPHKPQVFPGAHEPRMTAGLSEPQTADLTDDQLVDLTAHWFWIEAEHSPDTGGHLPSSSVQWCLGGPRGDDNWPRSRTRNLSGRRPAPSTQRTCRTPMRTPSAGDLGRPGGKLCSGFHSQEEKLEKTDFSKFKKRDNKTEKRSAAYYFVSVSVSVTGFVCGNSRTTKD